MIFIVVIFLCLPVFSFSMPVHDPLNYAAIMREVQQSKKNFFMLKNQYDLLKKQWDTLKIQQQQLKENYQAMTGQSHWGHFANRFDSLKQTILDPVNRWHDRRHQLSISTQSHQSYDQDNMVLTSQQFALGSTPALSHLQSVDRQTNKMITLLAKQPFNRLDEHLKALKLLSNTIDSKDNHHIKSAIDLNTRMVAESALIQVEMVQLLVLLVQQTARVEARHLSHQALQSKFNQSTLLPEHLRKQHRCDY
ncbi:MAG: hypothetical protein HAW62_06220 [Endozoicomonadaceae bacterium]|nr:hypothetical protein [Endozoicomonadaceae bacterium]